MRNTGYRYEERIGPPAVGKAVIDWLAERYTHSTRATWMARIEGGEVLVDGSPAPPDFVLQSGQRLVWNRPPWDEPDVPLRYELIHLEPALLAVDKPSGLPTQPAGGFLHNTLQRLVRERFPGATPVHRLGRGTSGIVLFARTPQARRELTAAFREGRVRKIYRAIVTGSPPWERRSIDVPIGPVPHPLLTEIHAASPTGKHARSHVRVLARYGDSSLVEVRIETGRPHQIRIHLAAVGHPLLGDPLYLPGGHPRTDALPGDEGYRLRAIRLELENPPLHLEVDPERW